MELGDVPHSPNSLLPSHVFSQADTKTVFDRGSAPDHAGELTTLPQIPISWGKETSPSPHSSPFDAFVVSRGGPVNPAGSWLQGCEDRSDFQQHKFDFIVQLVGAKAGGARTAMVYVRYPVGGPNPYFCPRNDQQPID